MVSRSYSHSCGPPRSVVTVLKLGGQKHLQQDVACQVLLKSVDVSDFFLLFSILFRFYLCTVCTIFIIIIIIIFLKIKTGRFGNTSVRSNGNVIFQ